MTIRFYCEVCGDHQEADIEPLERKGPNPSTSSGYDPDPWGDIVCTVCHFVIATASADEEGKLVFVEDGSIEAAFRATMEAAILE